MAFVDKIILSIKRDYGKEEKFALLLEKVRNLGLELGITKSDLAEKEFQIKNALNTINQLKSENAKLKKCIEKAESKNDEREHLSNEKKRQLMLEIKRDALYKDLRRQIKSLTETNKRLRSDKDTLISKLASRANPV